MSTKIGAAAITLLIILGGIVYYFRTEKPSPALTGSPAVSDATGPAATTTATADAKAQPAASTKRSLTPSLTYDEAVTLFGGRRIQFDENCNMEPSQITFRNDTSVMFDNRSSSTKTVRLDGKAYNLGSFDFVIVNLRNRVLPHTISVDCGEGRNNGQITLQ